MTSAINTSGINVNYPVPGVNNSSQGFRDNFSAIKTNINTAANEITDLQNKAILKSALDGTVLDNNMANTLISNAATRGFRASTYNLGNDLSGIVVVNVSLGDVQYGTITANTTLQFTGWAPSGTQSNVQLQLAIANSSATISLPAEVTVDGSSGVMTLENVSDNGTTSTLSIPYGVQTVDYRFSTLNCGNSITIEPYNRPRQATQIQLRTPSPVGEQGDVAGTVCLDTDTSTAFATCTITDGTNEIITCDSTAGFYLDMPVVFTGTTFGGITAGVTYYVAAIPSATTFMISTAPGTKSGPSSFVNLSSASGTMYVSPVSYLYVSSGSYDGNIVSKYATSTDIITTTAAVTNTRSSGNVITVGSTAGLVIGNPVTFNATPANVFVTATYGTVNTITVSSTTNMYVGGKITFSGSVFGGLSATSYYITNIFTGNSNITVSTTFSGSNVALNAGTTTGNCVGTFNQIMGNLTSNTYYVKTLPNSTSMTISSTQYGAPVGLTDENGYMTVTGVTDYRITLNSTTNISNNDVITFTGNVFGGVESNTVYYVSNVVSGTTLSISETRANGIAGQTMALNNATGNMAVSVHQGVAIWKRTQFNPW